MSQIAPISVQNIYMTMYLDRSQCRIYRGQKDILMKTSSGSLISPLFLFVVRTDVKKYIKWVRSGFRRNLWENVLMEGSINADGVDDLAAIELWTKGTNAGTLGSDFERSQRPLAVRIRSERHYA